MKPHNKVVSNSLLRQFFIIDSNDYFQQTLLKNSYFKAFEGQPHYVFILHKGTTPIQYKIDFCTQICSKGTVLFVAEDQFKTFDFETLTDCDVILFSHTFLQSYYPNNADLTFSPLFNYSIYSPIIRTSTQEFELLQNIVRQMKTEYHQSDDFATIHLLQSLLRIFLLHAERLKVKSSTQAIDAPYYKAFIGLQELLRTNIFKARSVKTYATALFMSTKKLNMITQEIIGQPSKTFITNTLILEIKRKLAHTTDSIKNIGAAVGFDEPTNFVKFFKKYEGVTPAKFRESQKNQLHNQR